MKPPPCYPCINEEKEERDSRLCLTSLRDMENRWMLMDEIEFLEKFVLLLEEEEEEEERKD